MEGETQITANLSMQDMNPQHSLDDSIQETSTAAPENSEGRPRGGSKGGPQLAQSTTTQASFNLIKTFIGAGILALPYSFRTAGLGLSLIGTITVGYLTYYCMNALLQIADDKKDAQKISLQKLAFEILGKFGMKSVEVSIFIMQVGVCIGLLLFANQFLNRALCIYHIEALCGSTLFDVALTLAITVPLTLINNIHHFYIPSMAATGFVVLAILTQSMYSFGLISDFEEPGSVIVDKMFEFHITKIPLFFGVSMFSFEGVGVLFNIRASMKEPELFPKILRNQIFTLVVLYFIFPAISYISLGKDLPEIVFFSLPHDNVFYLLVQVLYVVSALLGYPVQLFPAVRIIENSKFLRYNLFDEKGRTKNPVLRYSIRFVMICLMLIVVYTAKSFHLFVNLLGSCVFTYIGFILPILMYNKYFEGRISENKQKFNKFILIFGTVLGIAGFVVSLIELINYEG